MQNTVVLPREDHVDLADVRRRVKAIFIGSIGNLVEWYDFYAYAAFALYFAPSFFPGTDPVVQQLNAALLFALGFIVRPIGGWLFGHLADHYGRRTSLMLSVLLMCFGSLMIAVTPTYASIGIGAPILLGLARMVQGLSLGGEYGTSATYLSEVADEKHRGFYSSFQYVTLIGGQLCAILVLLLLQQVFLTPEELRAWGWRIPFVVGALLAVTALLMRRNLHETDEFVAAKKVARRTSSVRALARYPREVLLVVGLTMGGTTAFYTYTTYMQKFLRLSVGLNDIQTTMVTAASLIFALCLQPTLRRALGQNRPQAAAHLVRGHGHAVHDSAARRAGGDEKRVRRLSADCGRMADRGRLYVDQRSREGRVVSHERARDRGRTAVRGDRVHLWRNR